MYGVWNGHNDCKEVNDRDDDDSGEMIERVTLDTDSFVPVQGDTSQRKTRYKNTPNLKQFNMRKNDPERDKGT